MKTQNRSYFLFPLMVVAAVTLSACSTAREADPSGFLAGYSDLQEGTYFKQQMITSGVDYKAFKAVKVAPVNLSFLDAKTSCDTKELEKLASEFRDDIETQLKKHGILTTSHPGDDTLILSVALTNVEPPNRLLNAGLTAASVFCPVPLPFDQDGQTSFEGKITDAETGKVLIKFAEVRTGSGDEMSIKAMTVGKYTKFTNSQAVFSGWAQTIATMLKDLTSGVDPASKSQAGKTGKSLTKQAVGLVA